MGDRHINDDHAADLTHVREVHDVVDNLRRLLVAAAEADQAAVQTEAFEELDPAFWLRPPGQLPPLQSPPGR